MNHFFGRQLVIATMHHKEKVMAPILEQGLGVSCLVAEKFNTDIFGTFAGEIERTQTALETVRKKCEMAIEATNCDLVVASEGSFGSHPEVFFASANEELVMLMDRKNNLEIVGKSISFSTNFAGQFIENEKALWDFADQVGFPNHGLILRPDKTATNHLVKGIVAPDVLLEQFHKMKEEFQSVFVETDMRALYNPMRMDVIAAATRKLVENTQSLCPECHTPGFVVSAVHSGLPCSWCGSPTRSTLSHEYSCKLCGFSEEKKYPNHKTTEDPGFCNYCNP